MIDLYYHKTKDSSQFSYGLFVGGTTQIDFVYGGTIGWELSKYFSPYITAVGAIPQSSIFADPYLAIGADLSWPISNRFKIHFAGEFVNYDITQINEDWFPFGAIGVTVNLKD